MKIAFVSDVVYPFSVGGSEYRLFMLDKNLVKMQSSVRFFVGKWWDGPSRFDRFEGIRMSRRLYRSRRHSIRHQRTLSEPLSFTAGLMLKALFCDEAYDIIEMNASPLLHFALIPVIRRCKMGRKACIVAALHEIWLDAWRQYYGGLDSYLGIFLERYAFSHADHIITMTWDNKSKLVKCGVDPEKISVIRPGIDHLGIQRIPEDKDLLGYDVFFSGRLVREKGPHILLKAIGLIHDRYGRDIRTGIIGDGPLKAELMHLSDDLRIRDQVEFLDFQPRTRLIQIMKASKILAYPMAPEGGWSIVMMEANSAGLPVITSRVSPVGVGWEIVRDGYNGYLSDGTVSDFAEKLLLLLEDEGSQKRMGENGKKYAEEFDWGNIAKQTFAVYEGLVRHRK